MDLKKLQKLYMAKLVLFPGPHSGGRDWHILNEHWVCVSKKTAIVEFFDLGLCIIWLSTTLYRKSRNKEARTLLPYTPFNVVYINEEGLIIVLVQVYWSLCSSIQTVSTCVRTIMHVEVSLLLIIWFFVSALSWPYKLFSSIYSRCLMSIPNGDTGKNVLIKSLIIELGEMICLWTFKTFCSK